MTTPTSTAAGPTAAPAPPAPGGPSAAPAGPPVAVAVPAPRSWRSFGRRSVATTSLLRAGMMLALLPIGLFAAAVHLGVARSDRTIETVGRDATRGITVAQQVKSDLAELDATVVQHLLAPVTLAPSGFPEDYDAERRDLEEDLVLAASQAPPGPAYQQPLVNIDYALGHYHALLRDSFAAAERGDAPQAAALYGQAHEVMESTLLPQADWLDKANTYVLNTTYDSHRDDAASTIGLIVVSLLLVLGFLAALQVLVARRFRRLINLALVAASLIALVTGSFALGRLDASSSSLADAREEAFDPVHQLARAQAVAVAARQAEGHWLLDPAAAAASEDDFALHAARLLRLEDGSVTDAARSGRVPDGAGGYLARVAGADVSPEGNLAAGRALETFSDFVEEDARLRELVAAGDVAGARDRFMAGEAFDDLTAALDRTQRIDQDAFDSHTGAAARAIDHVVLVNIVAAVLMLGLTVLGLYQRLREYQD